MRRLSHQERSDLIHINTSCCKFRSNLYTESRYRIGVLDKITYLGSKYSQRQDQSGFGHILVAYWSKAWDVKDTLKVYWPRRINLCWLWIASQKGNGKFCVECIRASVASILIFPNHIDSLYVTETFGCSLCVKHDVFKENLHHSVHVHAWRIVIKLFLLLH